MPGAAALSFSHCFNQSGARLVLCPGPVDRAFVLIDRQGIREISLGHHRGRAAFLVLVLAGHFGERGGAIAVLQCAKHPAAIDARKLPVVAYQDQLRAGGLRLRVNSAISLVSIMAASSTMTTVRPPH